MNENLENKFICKYCGRIFKRQCDLTRHINIKHLKITKSSGYSFKTKKKCPNCGGYISIVNFNRHYKSCINKKQKIKNKDVEEIFNKCTIENNKYICPICNKKFNKSGIKIHIWRMHTNEGNLFNPNEGYEKGIRHAWNKGLTKYTDKRVEKIGKLFSLNAKLGLHKYNNRRRFCATKSKYGWYKGIYCDSSWELAFLIYNLDNNKKVIREERGFEYIYNNKKHKYYPDFLIDNIYYEIKGRDNCPEITKIKMQVVKDNNFDIKILYKKDIDKYIEYVKNKYNVKRVEFLYDKDRKNNVFVH